jgi:hypothetical protein
MVLCLLLNGQEASEVVNFEWLVDSLYTFLLTTKWEYITKGRVGMEGRIIQESFAIL